MTNTYLDLLAYFGIGGAHPGGFNLTKAILENENIQPNESVLDVGCGTGQTAAFLAEKYNCQVTAIDNHPIMIQKARQRFKKIKVPVMVLEEDLHNLDFVDSSFDLIISESVIVFTDISRTLKEISRVLKSDGSLIMIEMTAEQYLSEKQQKIACNLYGINEVLNTEEWILRLHQAGLTQVEIINTPPELIKSEINDINPSIQINMDLFDIWEKHNEFLLHNGDFISYRVFKCRK